MEMTFDSSFVQYEGVMNLSKKLIDTKTLESLIIMRLTCDEMHYFTERLSEDKLSALAKSGELDKFILESSRMGTAIESTFDAVERMNGLHRFAYRAIARRKMVRSVEEFSDMVLFAKAYREESSRTPIPAEELISRIA